MIRRIKKLIHLTCKYRYLKGLMFGVAAAVEHEAILKQLRISSFIDIGANKGQFTLVARQVCPHATIVAFEPLKRPSLTYRKLFKGDGLIKLHEIAISEYRQKRVMHISAREDSSSLLPITKNQETIFPGTHEVSEIVVETSTIEEFVSENSIEDDTFLKIDVQGAEMEVLGGCNKILKKLHWVYCECSFVELYEGQCLASDIIDRLHISGFSLIGIYNVSYDNSGTAVQADFLFENKAAKR